MGEKNSFYSRCTVTADGRWFDRGGLPIDKPSNLVKHTVDNEESNEIK